jgi:hypothetical protein
VERFDDILFVKTEPGKDIKSRFFRRIYEEGTEYKYVLHSMDDVYLHVDNLIRTLELESTNLYYGRQIQETGYMADHWYLFI